MMPLASTLRMRLLYIVRDVEVARAVHRHACGKAEFRAGGRAAVALEAVCAAVAARHGGDDAVGVHLADARLFRVRDVEVARAVHRHAIGDS